MQSPTIGRIVHYVLPNGKHRPAIIVEVWPEEFPNNPEEKTGLNLQVFLDGTNDNALYEGIDPEIPYTQRSHHGTRWATSAAYSSSLTPHTWHWPEMA